MGCPMMSRFGIGSSSIPLLRETYVTAVDSRHYALDGRPPPSTFASEHRLEIWGQGTYAPDRS